MYKFYIRVALIGDDEQTTSLWEYRDFDSDYWDKRSRGLGATVHIPLASAGDDNSRCKYKDRCVSYTSYYFIVAWKGFSSHSTDTSGFSQ